MNPELQNKLIQKFPSLFIDRNKSPMETLICFGCECGDGWYSILEHSLNLIDQHCRHNELEDIRLTQVKEKYGSLCIYLSSFDSYIDGVVNMAEEISATTCEECGNLGSIDYEQYWLECRCENCRQHKS